MKMASRLSRITISGLPGRSAGQISKRSPAARSAVLSRRSGAVPRRRLVRTSKPDRGQHRPEDLLLRNLHPRLDLGEHRRLDEKALALVAFRIALAAAFQLRPLLDAGPDVAQNPFQLRRGNLRPHR